MRTTVRLNDALLRAAKQEAARRGQTLTALIEQGLRLALARNGTAGERRRIPVATHGGGPLPGLDLDRTSALLDWLERESGKY